MSRVAPGLALAIALVAVSAHADPILYATAATTGELTSYCVGTEGRLDPVPRQRVTTLGNSPSRIIQHATGGRQFLYVAENDRVEVYEVGANGRLTRNGRIPARPIPTDRGSGLMGMNPHDLAIGQGAGGESVLYVPQRAFDRLAAFPLDPGTGLSTVRTATCTGRSCRAAADCAAGETCSGGACVQGSACRSDADCASGQTCDSSGVCLSSCTLRSVCTGRTCGDTAPCDAGQACVSGVCVQESTCSSNADCAGGQTCQHDFVPDAACAAEGGFCTAFSDQTGASCILGPSPSEWEDVEAANGLLYVSRAVFRGEVAVYDLAPDGNFANGEVIVNENIGADFNPEQCAQSGCTTGQPCGVTSDCTVNPDGDFLRCVPDPDTANPLGGRCVGFNSPACTNENSACTQGQTCVTLENSPCNQNGKAYTVPATNCTTGVELTDIDGFPITRLPTDADPAPPPLTVNSRIEPYAHRRKLNGAGALAMQGDAMLYVSERFRRAISAFELCPAGGQPVDCSSPADPKRGERCTCPDANEDGVPDVDDLCPPFGFSVDAKFNRNGVCTLRFHQPRLSRTGGRTTSDIRYNAMTLAEGMTGSTLLGAQFLDGRIDGYRLRSNGGLPRNPTLRTSGNFRTSPFRMFVYRPSGVSPADSAGVLYVGAGDVNRVQAYRLFANGNLRDRTPFSETDTLDDTFPNEVTVVDLPGACAPEMPATTTTTMGPTTTTNSP